MKKRMLTMVAVLAIMLSFAVPSVGAQTKIEQGYIDLDIQGTTAYCYVDFESARASDSVKITMSLWQGNTIIKTWSQTGTGGVTMSKTATVALGKAYDLDVTPVVNGVVRPTFSATDFN